MNLRKSVKNCGVIGLHSFYIGEHQTIVINEPLNEIARIEVTPFWDENFPLPIMSSTRNEQICVLRGALMVSLYEILDHECEGSRQVERLRYFEGDGKVWMKQPSSQLYVKGDLLSLPAKTLRTYSCSPFHWTSWQLNHWVPKEWTSHPDEYQSIFDQAKFCFTNRDLHQIQHPDVLYQSFTEAEAQEIFEKAGLTSILKGVA